MANLIDGAERETDGKMFDCVFYAHNSLKKSALFSLPQRRPGRTFEGTNSPVLGRIVKT
jgi:hypothetical protein